MGKWEEAQVPRRVQEGLVRTKGLDRATSPPLGMEFGPGISLTADKVIALQIPPDNNSIHWDEHWRGSPGNGSGVPLGPNGSPPRFYHWGDAEPL